MDKSGGRRVLWEMELRERFAGKKKVLTTFAHGDAYLDGQVKLNLSAVSLGEFDEIHTWNKRRLLGQANLHVEYGEQIEMHRGAGYWIWKPYIIQQALQQCRDGDFVLYTDTGPQTSSVIRNSVLPMIHWLEDAPKDRVAIMTIGFEHGVYTKRDCFIIMGCDEPRYHNARQAQTSFVGLLANHRTRELIDRWAHFNRDLRIVSDRPSTLGEELPRFEENRHDQSILTNLLIKGGFECCPFELPWDRCKSVNAALKVFGQMRLG